MNAMRPDLEFAAFLAEGRFMLQRVTASGEHIFYPRVSQPGTGDAGLEWVEASGRGVVYSTTVVRNKPPAADYNVALIDLAEDVRMMARVTGIAPEAVRIGMAVRARVGEIDGTPAILFAPDEAAA